MDDNSPSQRFELPTGRGKAYPCLARSKLCAADRPTPYAGVVQDDADKPRFIETLPKRGYRFIVAVTPAPDYEAPVEAPASAPVDAMHRSVLRIPVAALTLGVLLSSLIGVLGWRRWQHQPPAPRHNQPIESVAVLPLRNLSNDPDQEYFSDGITDELITDLAKLGRMRVISHTSVERYKGTTLPLPQVARELGVDAVVEGTIARSGDRVRITAQLIDGRSDRHLWAESYERSFQDILSLQDEVARNVATQIALRSTPPQPSGMATARSIKHQAYDAYLRGRYLWSRRTPESVEKAIIYFRQALDMRVAELPADVKVIPGYGNVSSLDDVKAYANMLEATVAVVDEGVRNVKTLEQLKRERVLDPWKQWSGEWITSYVYLETVYNELTGRPGVFMKH